MPYHFLRLCDVIIVLLLGTGFDSPTPASAQDDSVLLRLRAVDRTHFDSTCAPCRDFFGFVNGGWYRRTAIPARYTLIGVDRDVQDRTEALLHQILERAAAAADTTRDPTTRRIGLFYGTCMDSARAEREGYEPIGDELAAIGQIHSRSALAATLGSLSRLGVDAGIPFFAAPDRKNSSVQFLNSWQGGMGLPDRDLYLLDDSNHAAIRTKYQNHIARLLFLIGEPAPEAAARRIVALEMSLALGALRAEDARDPNQTDHRMPAKALRRLAPTFDWTGYFAALGTPQFAVLNVGVPREIQAFDRLLRAISLADWQSYLRWRLISATAPYLSRSFQAEALTLTTIVSGETELKPRWQRCLDATDQEIGEALGELYVRVALSPEGKAHAEEMVNNLRATMTDRIRTLEWMSDSTKAKALSKLDAMGKKVGYPERWRDYSALQLSRGPFVRNVLAANAFEVARHLSQINQPVDKSEWFITPSTFGAYNDFQRNEIVVPAGILQPPLYDLEADDAVNYGAIGAAIGHELTHGFDDQGRWFDAYGNLRNWWNSSDSARFYALSQSIVEQYNGYIAVDTFHVNGKLTLGENIADISGLMIAHDAWRRSLAGKPEPPVRDGFTAEQRFFIAYAESWRQKLRPELELTRVIGNPHAPARWRVNGVVGHLPEFARAFGCVSGDSLARPAKRQIRIW
jgi:predicted metalloendopeptidase